MLRYVVRVIDGVTMQQSWWGLMCDSGIGHINKSLSSHFGREWLTIG